MADILMKAGCYVAIILLGHILRRTNFFGPEAFSVLSKTAIRITLPAAVITSFAGKQIDLNLLGLALVAFGCGVVYMFVGWLLNRSQEDKAFGILNTAGFNIGNFTLPFVQSFLGPAGVVAASLFDVGNACICLGGSHAVAALVKDGRGFDPVRLAKALLSSTTFMTYVVMVTLRLLDLSLPAMVVDCAGIIGNANAFVAMLMVGVGFKLETSREQIGRVLKVLIPRYAIAAAVALVCWHFLPFDTAARTTAVILLFSPIASAAPAYTEDLGGNTGLSAAISSISILCSILIIVSLLMILL